MNAKDLVLKRLLLPSLVSTGRKYPNFNNLVLKRINWKNLPKFGKNRYVLSTIHSKFRKSAFNLNLTAIAIAFPFVVKAWGNRNPKEEEKKILEEADRLFDESKFEQLNELLRSQASWYDNSDILWRVARCEFHLSKRQDIDAKEANNLLEEAHRHVIKALELNDECGPAHKVCFY